MFFSVVIPFYNRSDALYKCLQSLFLQKFPYSDFEIIVVNDGSTEDFPDIKIPKKIKLHVIKQNNSGQAVARNKGLLNATGEYILFLDSDVTASPLLLQEHKNQLIKTPWAASLGNISFPPNSDIDLITSKSDLGYYFSEYQDKKLLSFIQFITCNIAISRHILIKSGGFSDKFNSYGYEDIELGYRLYKELGTQVIFNKKAKGYHLHKRSFEEFTQQQISLGKSQVILCSLHPEIVNHIKLDINRYYKLYKDQKIEKIISMKKLFSEKSLNSQNIEKYMLICRLEGIHSVLNQFSPFEEFPADLLKENHNIRDYVKPAGPYSMIFAFILSEINNLEFPIINNNFLNRFRRYHGYFNSLENTSKRIKIIRNKGEKLFFYNIPFLSKKKLNISDIKDFFLYFNTLPKYNMKIFKKILFLASIMKLPLNIYRYYRKGINIFDSIIFSILDKFVFIIRILYQ